MLTLASALAPGMCQHHAHRRFHPRVQGSLGKGDTRGPAIALTGEFHKAAHGHTDEVDGVERAVRPVLSERGDRGHDELRIDRVQGSIT